LDHDVLLTGNKDSQHNLSTLLARERAQQSYGEITAKAVGLFQKTQRLPPTNAVDQATAAALNALLQRWGLLEKPPNGPQVSTLHGNLVFDYGLPATGVTLRLYNIGFGDAATRIDEVKSDAQGAYSFSFPPPASTSGVQAVNLQVRTIDAAGKEITISSTLFNAGPNETPNLVVPASVQPLVPEFQRLSADMQRAVGGIAKLGQAQEGADRQDLTLLNQSTGWDA